MVGRNLRSNFGASISRLQNLYVWIKKGLEGSGLRLIDILSQQLPVGSEGQLRKTQPARPVFRPGFELNTTHTSCETSYTDSRNRAISDGDGFTFRCGLMPSVGRTAYSFFLMRQKRENLSLPRLLLLWRIIHNREGIKIYRHRIDFF
jgi:hypothetical protein